LIPMQPEPAHALLDPDVVSSAETLGLHARQIVEGFMAGGNRSPLHGFAAEFLQHREYTPGDDLRHLDWKVLGRSDRTFIRQYEQETNYVAYILLDGSRSMNYGSAWTTKLQYGKVIAACLLYLILQQRDAVGIELFDTTARQVAPRASTLGAINSVLMALASFSAQGQTDVASALHNAAERISRRGIVIVISDLFDDEQKFLNGLQHLRFAGHEIIVFHVLDPAEMEFPFSGAVEFNDMECSETIVVHAHEIRTSYLRQIEQFCRRIRVGCDQNDSHYVLANSGRPLRETLGAYLAFRQRKLR
jgi:uncharacterized protein (DUF58 family)